MFPGTTEPKLEAGFLRSGRRFRSGKIRKTKRGRQNPIMFEESEHKLRLQEDEGSCDEEEDYIPISERMEELEESAETPRLGCNYITSGI